MVCKFGLWVNTVGFQCIQKSEPYPSLSHPRGYYFNVEKGRILQEYQIVYITRGKGVFKSDEATEQDVCCGRLILIYPGQWHTYHPSKTTGWEEYYIGFQGSIADAVMCGGFFAQDN